MSAGQRRDTFEHWLSEHRSILFKVIRAYASGAEDREDLFQEIALQLWRSVPAFRGESAVTTWIYRIALNTALKWNGRERARQELAAAGEVLHGNEAFQNEQLNWLYDEIGKLSRVDRSLILLLLDGFSYREIASITGLSESNTGVRIHRIKQQLAEAAKTPDRHGI